MSEEATKHRELANAIDVKDTVEGFIEQYRNSIVGCKLRLEWDVASQCPGYNETRDRVVELVRIQLPDLLDEVIEMTRNDEAIARCALSDQGG